ncbi:hypothetical protein EBQ90_11835 [bacterium]|nr:hypothetical protein [bacterium]
MLIYLLLFLSSPGLTQGPNLVELQGEPFVIELQYLRADNFLKKNVYGAFGLKGCYVRPELHKKLSALAPTLKQNKKKLVFWDCYRPLKVQEAMWKLVPEPRYVADPKIGSNHNRGAAIDVALADEQGKLLKFPTPFDDFSPKASPQYVCSENEKEQCQNRDFLIQLLASVGLEVFPTEWWHYQLPKAEKLPVIPTFEGAK